MGNPRNGLFTHDNRVIPGGATETRRVMLYSHDSFGLGHFRRNLAIARALVASTPQVSVLMLSGSPCATQFSLPERCDVVKLPTVGKNAEGRYVPKSLGISLEDTLDLRRRLIDAAYQSFNPDVVIVDHQLTGLFGEALPMVRKAREHGKLTVFGMRDIVDSAEAVARDWGSAEAQAVLQHDYARIVVYGDRQLFDTVSEYRVLEPFRHKISSVGYIASPIDRAAPRPIPTLDPQVLVTVGGGEDGAERVHAYVEALSLAPVAWNTHIITGPLMKRDEVRACTALVDRSRHARTIRISRFHSDIPGLMQQADAVVSMAGYNSCVEALRSRKPTVLLPRERMRDEQRMRAGRFAARGLAQSVESPDAAELRAALETALSIREVSSELPSLDGLHNVCRLVSQHAGTDHDVARH